MAKTTLDGRKIIAENRRARFEYSIIDTYEAGLMLTGSEVKSLRSNGANIGESYATIEDNGALTLVNAHIAEHRGAHPFFQHAPRRVRKLLMRAKEINKLKHGIEREGMTIVPLELYFNPRGLAKLKLALAKGKKAPDRREATKKREWERDKARIMRDKG